MVKRLLCISLLANVLLLAAYWAVQATGLRLVSLKAAENVFNTAEKVLHEGISEDIINYWLVSRVKHGDRFLNVYDTLEVVTEKALPQPTQQHGAATLNGLSQQMLAIVSNILADSLLMAQIGLPQKEINAYYTKDILPIFAIDDTLSAAMETHSIAAAQMCFEMRLMQYKLAQRLSMFTSGCCRGCEFYDYQVYPMISNITAISYQVGKPVVIQLEAEKKIKTYLSQKEINAVSLYINGVKYALSHKNPYIYTIYPTKIGEQVLQIDAYSSKNTVHRTFSYIVTQ
jgi:hypothetical protein